MNVLKGLVVKAVSGRDNGKLFAVVMENENYCFIADGKSRKIEKPKMKSKKHLLFTNDKISFDNITNKKLRKLLSEYSYILN